MKTDHAHVEAYIEQAARDLQSAAKLTCSLHAFKYGALFTVLDHCLAVMSEQQKEVAIGHMMPRAERCSK